MANLCREAALYPVRDAATSIEHISLDEVKKRRGCKGRRRGFREGGGALQREEGLCRGRRGFREGGGLRFYCYLCTGMTSHIRRL